jgi:hypothetical protein
MRDTTPIALFRTPRYPIHCDKTTSMRLSIRFPKQRRWCVVDLLRLVPKNSRDLLIASVSFVVDILLVPYHFTLQAFSVMFILPTQAQLMLVDPLRIRGF